MSSGEKEIISAIKELERRLSDIENKLSILNDLKREMRKVSANSEIVLSTVHAHGSCLGRLEQNVSRLNFRCPFTLPLDCQVLIEKQELKSE